MLFCGKRSHTHNVGGTCLEKELHQGHLYPARTPLSCVTQHSNNAETHCVRHPNRVCIIVLNNYHSVLRYEIAYPLNNGTALLGGCSKAHSVCLLPNWAEWLHLEINFWNLWALGGITALCHRTWEATRYSSSCHTLQTAVITQVRIALPSWATVAKLVCISLSCHLS